MKHPALARMIAVFLAIISILTMFAGIKGFDDTARNNKKAIAEADRLERRRLSYIELSEKLEGRTAYSEVNEVLTENREQHDSDAAEHRTELAEYSAKRGGYNMGADMLWEAKAELAGAKQAFAAAKEMLLQMQAAKDAMNASIAECSAAAAKSNAAAADAGAVAAALAAKKQEMPVEPTAPVEPVKPTEPAAPIEPAHPDTLKPTEPMPPEAEETEENKDAWDAYRASYAEYEKALEEWTKYESEYPALYSTYEAEKAEYDKAYSAYVSAMAQYETDKAAYDVQFETYSADMLAYQSEYTAWCSEFMEIAGGADFELWAEAGAAAYSAVSNALAAMPEEMKGQMSGIDQDSLPEIPSFDLENPTSPDNLINAFTTTQMSFGYISGILGQISGGFGMAISAMDAQLAAEINKMAGGELTIAPGTNVNDIIAMMDAMLAKGEWQIQDGLENIWYNLGEFEKDKAKLEERKSALDEEYGTLEQQQSEAEELKELERKYNSDRVVLTKIADIKSAVDSGESLEESAERYIANLRVEIDEDRKNGIIMSVLAVAVGITGVSGIPAAFEKTKKHLWLLTPPALCGAAALGAMLLSRNVSDPIFYSAMAALIFAAVHLLVVLPRNKIEV